MALFAFVVTRYYPYFDKRLCPTALECSNRNALFRMKLTLGGQ